MPQPQLFDIHATSLFLALINIDMSRNCLSLRSHGLVFSGCIPCTYLHVVLSRGICFSVLSGSPSGRLELWDFVSCYISTGCLGSKIRPCRGLPGDHSFLHAFPKIPQVSVCSSYVNLGGNTQSVFEEEKNVFKTYIARW